MATIEGLAAALGLVNIVLVARRSLWNYPFGIAMVALYFFVFFDARLYSDALLQIFFLVINGYGWWNWRRSARTPDGAVAIEALSGKQRLIWSGGTLAAILLWGWMMGRMTDAVAPFADATVAGLSVSAQILQSQRRVESWALWIVVDGIAAVLFWSRGLLATALLYALFFGLAVIGLRAWRKAQQEATA